MSIAQAYLAEFEQESCATLKCLERLPADQLAWQPHGSSMTLGYLAHHTAGAPAALLGMLQQDSMDVSGISKQPEPESKAQILADFQKSLDYVRQTLPTLSDEWLASSWRLTNGDNVIMEAPRGALLRSLVLNHTLHHRGQLTVYMRVLGVPVPSIYGPSGDENPFAAASQASASS